MTAPAGLRRLLIGLLVPAALLGMPGDARAAMLEGSVTNGTAGAPVPPGLTVTVVHLDGGGNEVARKDAPVGPEGRFRFDGVGGEPGSRYVVGLQYQGVTYATEVEAGPSAAGASPTLTAALTIHEVTEDDAAISVASDTLTIVEGGEGEMEVFQLLRVSNGSDRTYVGRAVEGGRQVLQLPVPSGAFDLAPGQGITPSAITSAPEGIATGDPVLPGETQLSYLYRVRVPRTGWALQRAVAYPTARLNVLVGEGLALRASRLTFAESVELKERRYRRYEGGPLPAGSELVASVEPDTETSSSLPIGLAVLLALVLAVALGGPRLLRRARARGPGRTASERLEERERVIEDIAALDDAFERGRIPRSQYDKTRPRLKKKLRALTSDQPSRPAP
jgi:hypothetical protein